MTIPTTRSRPRLRCGTRRTRVDALVVCALTTTLLLRGFVVEPVRVTSSSMSPTIAAGQVIMVLRLDRGPERGEVATLEMSGAPVLKRVVALAGDRVAIHDGQLWVNARPVAEPDDRMAAMDGTWLGPIEVPSGHVFVLGDDREGSIDSRHHGPVPLRSLTGRAMVRLWPPGLVR